MPDQAREAALHVARLEHRLVVLGPELVRHRLGLLALVIPRLQPEARGHVEPDREGVHERQGPAGERRDRSRVHAAAEVGTDRHIGDELALDGLLEEAVELLRVLRLGGRTLRVSEVEVPVAGRPRSASLGIQGHVMAGGQHPDPVEEGPVGEDVLEGEVLEQVGEAHLRREGRMLEQGLDLGSEREGAAEIRVVEGLDPVAVASEEELPRADVPDRQSEHPVEPLHGRRAPGRIRLQDDLGVGVGAE